MHSKLRQLLLEQIIRKSTLEDTSFTSTQTYLLFGIYVPNLSPKKVIEMFLSNTYNTQHNREEKQRVTAGHPQWWYLPAHCLLDHILSIHQSHNISQLCCYRVLTQNLSMLFGKSLAQKKNCKCTEASVSTELLLFRFAPLQPIPSSKPNVHLQGSCSLPFQTPLFLNLLSVYPVFKCHLWKMYLFADMIR